MAKFPIESARCVIFSVMIASTKLDKSVNKIAHNVRLSAEMYEERFTRLFRGENWAVLHINRKRSLASSKLILDFRFKCQFAWHDNSKAREFTVPIISSLCLSNHAWFFYIRLPDVSVENVEINFFRFVLNSSFDKPRHWPPSRCCFNAWLQPDWKMLLD